MPRSRTPLFSVSIAFALGCVLGIDGWITLGWAEVAFFLIGLAWLQSRRHPLRSITAFYALVAGSGLVHTILMASTIPANDLRRLTEEKTYPTTQWRGTVITEPVALVSTRTPRRAQDRTAFVLRVESWRPTHGRYFTAEIPDPWRPAVGDVTCTLAGPADSFKCGDRLETAMALEPMPAPLAPGSLDLRAYQAERGIYFEAAIGATNWRRIEGGRGDFWRQLSFRARDWTYARLQIGLEDDPRTADFLAGMLIGYRQQIPADIEQDFRRTGTLHVFAVSGQNIAELMVVAVVLLQLFGLVRWRWAWTLAPLVLIYCLLTGSSASAVRATLMVLAVLAAWRAGRPLNALGFWSLAFLAMLVWNPATLVDPGAQLSFGVVLGLILLGPPLARWLQAPFVHDEFLPRELLTAAQAREESLWKRAAQLLAASIAATLVSEPITAVAFHQVTPISVVANLIVVPAAGLITVVGTLAVALSLVTTTWAALLNNANWLFAKLLIGFVGFLAHEPGAAINVADLRTVGDTLPSFIVAPVQDSTCLLVRTQTQSWLFNTGREIPARNVVSHLLQYYGINRLDGLVLTQVSAADASGAAIVVRDFRPRHLVAPLLRSHSTTEKILPDLQRLAGQGLEFWQKGMHVELGSGVFLDVLNPSDTASPGRAETRSLVLLFQAGDGSLLWASRIGQETQEQLLVVQPNLRGSVLVLDQGASPSPEWLAALQVRHWLQFPRRVRGPNVSSAAFEAPGTCQPWPLEETGAVEIHFVPPKNEHPAAVLLRPWVMGPSK